MSRLASKIAMVVGAGQSPGETLGNGRATALLFAAEGATVLAVDRDIASAEQTVALIRREGGEAQAFEADVINEEALRLAVAECVSRWGRLDVLHNNVGISVAGGDASPTEITQEAFDRIIAVNLRGVVMACKHALPVMRKQGSGAIINISTYATFEPDPLFPTSGVFRSGLAAFTKLFADKYAADNVRMNNVLPGFIDSLPATEERRQRIPMQRYGTTDEVSALIASAMAVIKQGATAGGR